MLETQNIHMIKELVKGLEEHAERSELVYEQHIDILKGRLMDRDEQIEGLIRELAQYRGNGVQQCKTERDRRSTSRLLDPHQFDQSLKESRRQLSVLFKSKLEQFEQMIGEKSSKLQYKRETTEITPQYQKKLLIEVAELRNDKQIYERQLEAQGKLIIQYEKEECQRVKQLKQVKQKSRQHSKNEIKKIIDLYTSKYRQLVCNYSSFFTDITSFIRNQLDQLKKETTESLSQTWELLANNLVKLSEQLPSKIQKKSSEFDVSVLSKEQVLEFQVEELRKELLSIKAENCVMKFQLKRKQQKKQSQPKIQSLFDKNKFFQESSENNVQGTLKLQRSRKDSSRGTERSQKEPEEFIRQQMNQIRDKIKNFNNSYSGRTYTAKKWC